MFPDTLRCEDYEIFMRLHQLGYQGYNIQQYLFAYREDKQSFQKRRFHFRINEANSATGILKPCICYFRWAGSM